MRRAVVAVGRACDNACVFCAQDGLPRDAVDDAGVGAALEAARAGGADGVTFVGGEPAIDARIDTLVARARSMGFAHVGLQTNGRALAEPARVETLARGGLTDVHLSIHGAEARVHDWHTAIAGSFDAAMRTLATARAAGLVAAVATVLTRSNFRVLSPMPQLLASRGVAAWCIGVPRWRGRGATAADRVVPRLALALPFALHALDAAAALGLPSFVRGAPACLLGPFAARAIAGGDRAHGDTCAACEARASCPGVDREYLQRFGEGELARRSSTRAGDADEALRSLFVGEGKLVPPPAAAIEPPPERARVTLPVLGRPAPARGEVSGGAAAPRQTGEALREILPRLFERDPPADR